MDDLVERLNTIARGDHARGCGGRTYSCECGYDEQAWATADEAAARITKLEAALRQICEHDSDGLHMYTPQAMQYIARAALGEQGVG
jgi:hypothetical protein